MLYIYCHSYFTYMYHTLYQLIYQDKVIRFSNPSASVRHLRRSLSWWWPSPATACPGCPAPTWWAPPTPSTPTCCRGTCPRGTRPPSQGENSCKESISGKEWTGRILPGISQRKKGELTLFRYFHSSRSTIIIRNLWYSQVKKYHADKQPNTPIYVAILLDFKLLITNYFHHSSQTRSVAAEAQRIRRLNQLDQYEFGP